MADFTKVKNELEQLFEIESENRIPTFIHPPLEFSSSNKERPCLGALRSYLVYLLGQYQGKRHAYKELKMLINSIDDGSWKRFFDDNKRKKWIRIKAHPPELEYFGSAAKGKRDFKIPIAVYYV